MHALTDLPTSSGQNHSQLKNRSKFTMCVLRSSRAVWFTLVFFSLVGGKTNYRHKTREARGRAAASALGRWAIGPREEDTGPAREQSRKKKTDETAPQFQTSSSFSTRTDRSSSQPRDDHTFFARATASSDKMPPVRSRRGPRRPHRNPRNHGGHELRDHDRGALLLRPAPAAHRHPDPDHLPPQAAHGGHPRQMLQRLSRPVAGRSLARAAQAPNRARVPRGKLLQSINRPLDLIYGVLCCCSLHQARGF